jgi:hypothetical protein
MNRSQFIALILLACFASLVGAQENKIKAGDTLQLLSNLHPDNNKRLLYTLNYQQPGLMKVCEEIKVVKVKRKSMKFDYRGTRYEIAYEGYTKEAGKSFQSALRTYFGEKCDRAKIETLSDIDKEGIESGIPKLGMSKDGILFAMGRPPIHATPWLKDDYWLYWRNRFGKQGIRFDAEGKVIEIK